MRIQKYILQLTFSAQMKLKSGNNMEAYRIIRLLLVGVVLSTPQAYSQPIHDDYNANGHEYVDLGLSVLWATCNIGAESPEGYGDYFAWGETLPKSDYSLKTYKWCNGEMYTYTKYCDDREYGADGFVDTLIALEKCDDPAIAQWGGDWRMPNQLEYEELLINSTREWMQVNGINGYRFTSKVPGYEGKSIFLPCSGIKVKDKLLYSNEYGRYWSSDLYAHGQTLRFGIVKPVSSARNTAEASIIMFDESLVLDGLNLKVAGLPVRAVIKVNGKGYVMP